MSPIWGSRRGSGAIAIQGEASTTNRTADLKHAMRTTSVASRAEQRLLAELHYQDGNLMMMEII